MKKEKTVIRTAMWTFFTLGLAASAQPDDAFIGRWALTLPNQGAGWLGIEEKNGALEGSILWGGGSVHPLNSVDVDGDTLVMTRLERKRQKPSGWQVHTNTISATLHGNRMKLELVKPNPHGEGESRSRFTGKRLPPLPPRPDLAKAHSGEPIELFNGENLDGWRLVHPSRKNGWSARDGVLVNQPEKAGHGYGNLRTTAEFEDFNLKLEVKVPEKSNSGIYLRGMYEVQVLDSHGREPSYHNMGAVYSRIVPSQAAEREHDVWQQMDITLKDQHVTVVLNGQTIIDNQPLAGCTGGALWSDPLRAGPILLQGSHGPVAYRNIVLTPFKSNPNIEKKDENE